VAEKPRVVVVDDDPAIVALLAAALLGDYELAVATDGRVGLQLCRAGRVDLLVTDIGMPGLDGVQLLGELQKDARLAVIPVLVVTATHFTRLHIEQVKRFPQVRGIVLKPFEINELTATITGLVRGGRP